MKKTESKEKKKRKPLDREAIAKDIAAGMLFLREVARKHGCSPAYVCKIKTDEGIERDLSKRVRQSVRAKLVNKKTKVNTKIVNTKEEQEKFEKDAIEEAANEGVRIITSHRNVIQRCRGTIERFLDELKKDKVVTKVTDKGKKIYTPIPTSKKATLFNSITIAVSRLIPLERQAYNLDEEPLKPPGEGEGLTAYPSGPMSIAEWEKQINDKKRKNINNTGN